MGSWIRCKFVFSTKPIVVVVTVDSFAPQVDNGLSFIQGVAAVTSAIADAYKLKSRYLDAV